jgi:uroporphyrin-III C-methyltransferase
VNGKVWLVGAGPGDPDLLTVRATKALAGADVLLYDALVDPRALDLAPRAAKFFVGKRAGAPSMQQETIHRLMIGAARSGKNVVRLKAGDPFVLGRGGEEALALTDAGVPYEIVAGISSALAAPLVAGIPVTHRGIASSFTVVSAVPHAQFVAVARSLPRSGTTLVVLMGLGQRSAIRNTLLAAGFPASTRAAIVLAATGSGESVWSGTLDALPFVEIENDAPGTIVIGEVVAVRDALSGRSLEEVSRVSG